MTQYLLTGALVTAVAVVVGVAGAGGEGDEADGGRLVLRVWLQSEAGGDPGEASLVSARAHTRFGDELHVVATFGDSTLELEAVLRRARDGQVDATIAVTLAEAEALAGLAEPIVTTNAAETRTRLELGGESQAIAGAAEGLTWYVRVDSVDQ